MNFVYQAVKKPTFTYWFKKISNLSQLGLRSEYDQFHKSSIRYFNFDLLLGIILLSLSEIFFLFLNIEDISLIHKLSSGYLLISILALYLNSRYYYTLAVFIISAYGLFFVTLLTGYYGEASNIHFLLFVLGFSPLVHLSGNFNLAILLASLIVLALMVLIFFKFDFFPSFEASAEELTNLRMYSYPFILSAFVYKVLLSIFIYRESINELIDKGAQLRNSEATLRSVFNSTTDSVLALDKEMRCLDFNQVAALNFKEYFGIKLNIGKSIEGQLPRIFKEETRPLIQYVLNGVSVSKEFEFEQKGELITYMVSFSPIVNDIDQVIGCTIYSKNVSEYKRTEKALKESEHLYKTIFESSPQGLIISDVSDDKALYQNDRILSLLQLEEQDLELEDLIRMSPQFQPDGHLSDRKFMELKQLAKRVKRPYSFEWQFGTKHKSIDTEITFTPVHLEHKSLCLTSIRDITESKAISKVLKENEERYRSIFENNLLGIAVADPDLQLVNANPAFCDILNLPQKEVPDQIFLELLHPDSLSQSIKHLHGLIEKRQHQFNIQQIFNCKDGRLVFTNTNINGTYDSEGKLTSFIITIKDITDAKKTEIALKKSEERYRLLFENTFHGILLFDLDKGQVLSVNQRLTDILGTTENRILKESLYPFTPELQPNGDNSKLVLSQVIERVKQGEHQEFEWLLERADGSPLYCEVSSFLLPETGNKCAVTILKDVTEKKRAIFELEQNAEELNLKNQQLEDYIESNLQLENFAYMASHDLKEPLRAIICFSQLLNKKYKPYLDEEGKEYVDFITTSTRNMESMISDLLEYAKINTQNIVYEKVDFIDMVKGAQANLFTPLLESRAIITTENLPSTVYCISSRVKQLLQNLISNGIKFQEKGNQPQIHIKGEDYPDYWKITVSDNGLGIRSDFQDKIFLLFRKLHGKHQFEGTGIGLAICKKIVEQHGGQIGVESDFGKGASFYFTLSKLKETELIRL